MHVLWLNGVCYWKTATRNPTATLWYQVGPPVILSSTSPRRELLTAPPNTCIANSGQIASVSGMVTIWQPVETYRCLIRRYHRRPPTPVLPKHLQNLHSTLRPNCISATVAINRLQTFANAIYNVSIADPLPSKHGYWTTDPSFTFAGLGLPIPAYGLP